MGKFQANLRVGTQVAPPYKGEIAGKAVLIATALEKTSERCTEYFDLVMHLVGCVYNDS